MSQVGAEVVHHNGAVHADGGRQSCLGQGEGVLLNIVSKNYMIRISKNVMGNVNFLPIDGVQIIVQVVIATSHEEGVVVSGRCVEGYLDGEMVTCKCLSLGRHGFIQCTKR